MKPIPHELINYARKGYQLRHLRCAAEDLIQAFGEDARLGDVLKKCRRMALEDGHKVRALEIKAGMRG